MCTPSTVEGNASSSYPCQSLFFEARWGVEAQGQSELHLFDREKKKFFLLQDCFIILVFGYLVLSLNTFAICISSIVDFLFKSC